MCIQTLSGRVDEEARKTPKLSADMPFKGDDYYCFSQYLLNTGAAAATICSGLVNKPPFSPISVSGSRFLKSSEIFYFLLDICLSCAVAHIIGVQIGGWAYRNPIQRATTEPQSRIFTCPEEGDPVSKPLSSRVDEEVRKTPKLSADMPFKGSDYYCYS